jgi:hypothetical protein
MRLGLRPGQFNNAWRMRFSARNMPRGDRFESLFFADAARDATKQNLGGARRRD